MTIQSFPLLIGLPPPPAPIEQTTGRDISELDPELAAVKQRDLRKPGELRASDGSQRGDMVKRVPGYAYGIGEVVRVQPSSDPGRKVVTIVYPDKLHGRVNVEIGDDDRLEVHDVDEVEAP